MFTGVHSFICQPRLVAEIFVLQRQVDVARFQECDGSLQVVTFLTADAQLVALNGSLHLELAALDHLHKFSRQIGFDAFLQQNSLVGLVAGHLRFALVQTSKINPAFGKFLTHDVEHLLQLKIGLRGQRNELSVEDEFRPRALEVEACTDLTICLVDRIARLVCVEITNYIKRRHGLDPIGSGDNSKNSPSCPDCCTASGECHADNSGMTQETVGGASLQIRAIETLASFAAVERLQQQVFDLLVRHSAVSVTVRGLGAPLYAEAVFGQVCGALESAKRAADAAADSVVLAIDAAVLSPQRLWMRRNEILGPGPLYLLVGSDLTRPSSDPEERRRQDQFWLQCWHLRNGGHVRTALAPMVSSPCPLLSSEYADGILPASGLQVPPGTAWVPVDVNITDYTNERGDLSVFALRECLRRCVEYGESMHDDANWPTAAMRHDGWLNRRLAISVTGIGDLAKMRGLDPQSFVGLKDMQAVLQEIREAVNNHSRTLATETEAVPALKMSDPSRGPSNVVARSDWQSRWQTALRFAAIRHRNLLSISPWAVFPSGAAADSRYCDLLPLLAYADACSFPASPCIRGWNINEFKYFHHRTWAVLEQKDAQQMIAEQV